MLLITGLEMAASFILKNVSSNLKKIIVWGKGYGQK
jgi:hypothetical protein